MARVAEPAVFRESGALRIVMPAGRNPWFVVGAVVFGIPWLVAVVIGMVVAARVIPDSRTGIVWAAVLLGTIALTVLIDVLAAASIWLALYTLWGTETLELTSEAIEVRRKAAGIPMRVKAKRGHFDRVTLLDANRAPGKVPHPRIEVSGAYSRVRVGAGVSRQQAEELVVEVREFLGACGPN